MARRIQEYPADGITVRFDPNLCIHSARCLMTLPEVFDVRRRRWIAPEAASPDDIASAIERCPSGALTFERTDGGAPEAPAAEASIRPQRDGPLYIRGPVEVLDAEGGVITTLPRMALCRCGSSANKPFCDNTHRTTGFHD